MPLIRACRLAGRVLAGELPRRALLYGTLNSLQRITGSGSRRFEFERLYLEKGDPWNYGSSEYERRKYERTRASALRVRRHGGSALEVGCSIGIFTDMIAPDFERVMAVDISKEALGAAAARNARHRHVQLIRADFSVLDLAAHFDVIFCAEMLYYVRRRDVASITGQLDRFLARDGIVVVVNGEENRDDPTYFNEWENMLGRRFEELSRESFADGTRPYWITVFARRAEPAA